MKTRLPSSCRGTVFNRDFSDFPNEPGWYYWKPYDGVQHHRAEYVMVNYDVEHDNELRVWRAGTESRSTLPVQIMLGEWNFFSKLHLEKPE